MGEVQNNSRENETVNEDVMRAEKIAQAKGQGQSHADATAQTDTQVRATSDAPEGGGEMAEASGLEDLPEMSVDEAQQPDSEPKDATDGAN